MNRWNRMSLRSQIFIFLLTAAIVLVVIMGLTLFYSTSGIIVKEVADTTASSIDKSGSQLEMYIDRLKGLSDLLVQSPQVRRYFTKPPDEGGSADADRTDVETLIRSILRVDTEIESIILVSADGRVISNEKRLNMAFTGRIQEQAWYKEALAENMPVLTSARMQEFSMDKDNWVISLGREITDEGGKHIGILRIDLRYKAIETVLKDLNLGGGGFAFILDSKNQVVYHKNTAYFRDQAKRDELVHILEMDKTELSKDQKLVHRYKLKNTEWLLVGVATLDSAVKMQKDIVMALWILGAVMMIIALGSSGVFAASVSKPVRQLERIMQQVEKGQFNTEVDIKGSAEIESLSRHFISMVEQIKRLMEEIHIKEKSLRTSEIKTLHSQINPHFLYNTLDTIVWLAELGDAEKVVEVSKAMASFFRLSLRGGSELTTVREELEHARQYLIIQKERYQDKLSFEIEADESLYDHTIPKIILQPLVENAIYHGIRTLPGIGFIRIEARKAENGLVFCVEDNGVGFDTEVPHIREEPVRLGGVGLRNVDERIKLYYGKEFGLDIVSAPGKGTKIILRLGNSIL